MINKLTNHKDLNKTLTQTFIAFVWAILGSYIGATYIIYKKNQRVSLELSIQDVERIRETGGAVLVETTVGSLLVSGSPEKK